VSEDLAAAARLLAGTYSSRAQAMAEPVWFIPVHLWYVPLPHLFAEGIGLFSEQVSEHLPEQPYRSRVLRLADGPLRLENYRLKVQSQWAGGACDPERLARLTPDDLLFLEGCTIFLERTGPGFRGAMRPGRGCRLAPDDTSYVQIALELTADTLVTLDRGFDLVSDRQVWGSRAGPYRYVKLSDTAVPCTTTL